MSLDHLQAIPVDTHVFQIAKSRYLPNLSGTKTVTNRVYNEIADHFRKMFGDYAGWAHTVGEYLNTRGTLLIRRNFLRNRNNTMPHR